MKDTIKKAGFGFLGLATTELVSRSSLEYGIRITAEMAGLLLTLLSIVSICLKIRRQWKRRNDDKEPTTIT